MNTPQRLLSIVALFGWSVQAQSTLAAQEPATPPPPTPTPIYTFGVLRAMTPEAAQARCAQWLQSVGQYDEQRLQAIWAESGPSVFDKTVASLVLGQPEVGRLIEEAKLEGYAAPLELPDVFKDAKTDRFFRSNAATAYAKALCGRRIYEEALDALKAATPEDCVDPATYYFYKAVAEHGLMLRQQASTSIQRLLDDVADAPDRYKMVAVLMFFDLQNWSPDQKDLGNIGRLMDNSGRRLDLARGGPKTQEIQKKIVFRLDEVIKEIENAQKNQNGQGQGSMPGSGGNNTRPSGPAGDSTIMGGSGAGKVDEKRLKKLAEEWGKLPESERAKAIQEITRDVPAKYKPVIEEYFKSLNRINGTNK